MSPALLWTADSSIVTADSPVYLASGYGPGPSSNSQYPNVPALPGVPNLARLVPAAMVAAGATLPGETRALAAQLGLPATVTFGTNALYSGLGLQPLPASSPSQSATSNPFVPGALPPYGITNGSDNTPIIEPDSAVEFSIEADSTINSHPIEQGGFSAYNRVQEPISIRLLLACQGKNMSRSTFLSTLKSLREGTQIVTISTPDASFPNMTLKGFGYKKTAERGMVTIWADTQWQEERSNNVVVTSPPTSQPQGEDVSNLGTLQPIVVTALQMGSISNPPVVPAPLPLPYAFTAPPSGDAF